MSPLDEGYYLVHFQGPNKPDPGPGVLHATYNGVPNQVTVNAPDISAPLRQRWHFRKASKNDYFTIAYETWTGGQVGKTSYLSLEGNRVVFNDMKTEWFLVGHETKPIPSYKPRYFSIQNESTGYLGVNDFGVSFFTGLDKPVVWELIPARAGPPVEQ